MSYSPYENDCDLSEFLSRINDVNSLKGHIWSHLQDDDFDIWLDKLIKIDSRCTFILLKDRVDEMSERNKQIFKNRFKNRLRAL